MTFGFLGEDFALGGLADFGDASSSRLRLLLLAAVLKRAFTALVTLLTKLPKRLPSRFGGDGERLLGESDRERGDAALAFGEPFFGDRDRERGDLGDFFAAAFGDEGDALRFGDADRFGDAERGGDLGGEVRSKTGDLAAAFFSSLVRNLRFLNGG